MGERPVSQYALLYSQKLHEYDLGHVLTGERYRNFMELFRQQFGAFSQFKIIEPEVATDADLKLVHKNEYVERVKRLESADPFDTPLTPGLVRAARWLAGAGKLAGELVQLGEFSKAFVVGGGVQHATRDHERGFGVFSDVGICAENLMQNCGVEKILIIDTDAHAGEGVQEIFYSDPRVLCISLHQDPRTLFPGKGFVHEIGKGAGKGYCVNIPLPPHAAVAAYTYALESIFVPLAREFQPQIILMIDGSDPHFTDRITQMGLALRDIKLIGRMIGNLSGEICEGKLIDFIGSGYSHDPRIVSLGWLGSIAGVTGIEIEFEGYDARPAGLNDQQGLQQTTKVIDSLRSILSPYWDCFAS